MKKEIPELKKLELNPQNVLELLLKCKATPQSTSVNNVSFYSSESTRKAPTFPIDQDIVFSYRKLITYWFGQLLAIHNHKEYMTPGEGIINYKGEKWSSDNRALFALYYLGTSSTAFPYFVDGPTTAQTRSLNPFYRLGLKPTYPPNDSRFNIKDAKKALKDLGVDIDEQTHVD